MRIDLLSDFKDGYTMEPGISYDEVRTVVVPHGVRLDVDAEYVFSDDSTVGADALVETGATDVIPISVAVGFRVRRCKLYPIR